MAAPPYIHPSAQILPPSDAFAVVLDADMSDQNVTAISVGETGDVAVEYFSGNTAVFQNRQAGTELLGRFRRVLSTGTTADGLIANVTIG